MNYKVKIIGKHENEHYSWTPNPDHKFLRFYSQIDYNKYFWRPCARAHARANARMKIKEDYAHYKIAKERGDINRLFRYGSHKYRLYLKKKMEKNEFDIIVERVYKYIVEGGKKLNFSMTPWQRIKDFLIALGG